MQLFVWSGNQIDWRTDSVKKTTERKREDQFLRQYLQHKMAVVVRTGEGRTCRDGVGSLLWVTALAFGSIKLWL